MFKNLKLGAKIILGFSGLLVIACVLGGLAVWNMKSVQTSPTSWARKRAGSGGRQQRRAVFAGHDVRGARVRVHGRREVPGRGENTWKRSKST